MPSAPELANQVRGGYSPVDFTAVPVTGPRFAPGSPRGEAPVPMDAFPHGARISRLLGRPFAAAAFVDPRGCADRGVPAFTRSARVHFESSDPPLRIAAHEAVHVLQQGGATRDMSLGAERHAAAIERKVAAEEDARDLIGPHGAPATAATLDYTFVPESEQEHGVWQAKRPLRVSDDGQMAVGVDDSDHYFWAEKALVAESNEALDDAASPVRLKTVGDKLTGPAPDGSGVRKLRRVEPVNDQTKTKGDKMILWAECDRAAFTVMGTRGTRPGSVKGPLVQGVYKTPNVPAAEVMTDSNDPELMRNEFLGQQPGVGSLGEYKKLKPEQREETDAQAGINKYAKPNVGEAYTTAADNLAPSEALWIYHWGAVIMTSGEDRVTLENFSIREREAKNADWSFEMYGSANKPGQTFHERQSETGHHGDVPITMRVRNRPRKK